MSELGDLVSLETRQFVESNPVYFPVDGIPCVRVPVVASLYVGSEVWEVTGLFHINRYVVS